MLFQVYGENAVFQWIGLVVVFVALILMAELARRSKAGGIFCFMVLPAAVTVYLIVINVAAGMGAEWALNNATYTDMNSWFHYAKMYAACAGCIGFLIIKYQWGYLGKAHWFKCFPFVIVAINILIAVFSDFESAINAWNTTWVSSEGVVLYGGLHNVLNGIAGILSIFCMTGWFYIYTSKDQHDMLWPDMTWVYIISYDIWNFAYTYNCLPTHSWYCGIALLLAPTVASMIWCKGSWIQNRAATLAIWCMFAQVCPMFVNDSVFAVESVNNPTVNLVVSSLALAANAAALIYIIYRCKKYKIGNPYTHEVFVGTRDYEKAMERAIVPAGAGAGAGASMGTGETSASADKTGGESAKAKKNADAAMTEFASGDEGLRNEADAGEAAGGNAFESGTTGDDVLGGDASKVVGGDVLGGDAMGDDAAGLKRG